MKNLAVITPGFSADCLETLEEIAFENAHIFKKRGGQNFAAIPCLNDSAPGMEVIRRLAERELEGWVSARRAADDAACPGCGAARAIAKRCTAGPGPFRRRCLPNDSEAAAHLRYGAKSLAKTLASQGDP